MAIKCFNCDSATNEACENMTDTNIKAEVQCGKQLLILFYSPEKKSNLLAFHTFSGSVGVLKFIFLVKSQVILRFCINLRSVGFTSSIAGRKV